MTFNIWKNKKCSKPPTSITYMEEGYGFEEEKCLKKRLKTPGDSSGASLDANTLPPSTLLRFILLALLSRKRPGVGRRHS